jgi:hypothetical protein
MLAIADSLGRDFDYNQQIGIGSPIRVRTLGDSWDNLDWPGYRKFGKNKDGVDMDVIAELLARRPSAPASVRHPRHHRAPRHPRHDPVGGHHRPAAPLPRPSDRREPGRRRPSSITSWLDIDKAAPQAWIDHEKAALFAWECVASKVNHTLEADGRADRIATLPVGAALVDLVERVLADEVAGIAGSTPEKDGPDLQRQRPPHPDRRLLRRARHPRRRVPRLPVGAASRPRSTRRRRGPAADRLGLRARLLHDRRASACAPWSRAATSSRTPSAPRSGRSRTTPATIARAARATSQDPDANNGQNPFKWPDPDHVPWPAP